MLAHRKSCSSQNERRDCLWTGTCVRYLRVGLLWFACSLVVVQALAASRQPGIFGSDDRKVIDQLSAPWTAVGQVNVTGYRYSRRCTGSLIASNLVITAAHCVMDPWRRKSFPLDQIHFVAGVRGSGWLAHSTASCKTRRRSGGSQIW
jgi:V8-like Glu-specific endopeptidase